jgi:hypothetical protein
MMSIGYSKAPQGSKTTVAARGENGQQLKIVEQPVIRNRRLGAKRTDARTNRSQLIWPNRAL